ncbi:MAG: hypothetical protein ABIG08_01465 [bacterium]
MENYIEIKKKYLVFREDAKNLTQIIQKKVKDNNLKNIVIDFSRVVFMSRSFIDEFLNSRDELSKKSIKIQPVNLKADLQKFISRVKETKNRIRETLLQKDLSR